MSMDMLKAAMADSRSGLTKNRKKFRPQDDSSDSDDVLPKKKYKRRGEIPHLRSAEAEEEEEEAEDEEVEAKKEAEEEDEEADNIEPEDVMRRLRGYGLPVTLFGENHRPRLRRLKAYELEAHEKHGGSMGSGGEAQAIAEEVNNEIVAATLAAMDSEQQGDNEAAKKLAARKAKAMAKRNNKYKEMRSKDSFSSTDDYIVFFFKRMLHLWEEELISRDTEVKKSTKGKVASATQKQTRQYMKLLFSGLKKKETPKDVIKLTTTIVDRCIEREYVKANETYLKMAIGNASWPMGVTMVGIHERAGREKIFSQNVAHVLNDEKSRKYIQGMKRIMTFCQHAYPNVPSKMVI